MKQDHLFTFKKKLKKGIFSLAFFLSMSASVQAQLCETALRKEKITPTTSFFNFNGTGTGNITIANVTPATGSNGGLGWTGSGTGTILANTNRTVFNSDAGGQTMSRPITNANLDGNGAIVTISLIPRDGNGTQNANGATLSILYNGVVYASIFNNFGALSTQSVVTRSNNATGAPNSVTNNTANPTTVTVVLPPGIPNSGDLTIRYTVTTTPNATLGDDFDVFTVSFQSCPTSISGNVFEDTNGGTPDGTAIGGAGSATGQLFAVLDTAGVVLASVPVADDGTYAFNNVVYTSGTHNVRLSTTAGTVGQAPPAASLPDGWIATAETDNSPTLIQEVTVANATNNNLVNFNFGIADEATLPVTFGPTQAWLKDGTLHVNWSTLAEQNCKEYHIEGSADGKTWKTLGIVASKAPGGNSNIELEYEFTTTGYGATGVALALALLLVPALRNRKLKWTLAIMGILGVAACGKQIANEIQPDSPGFIRIVQYDIDGARQHSNAVKIIVK